MLRLKNRTLPSHITKPATGGKMGRPNESGPALMPLPGSRQFSGCPHGWKLPAASPAKIVLTVPSVISEMRNARFLRNK